MSKKIMIRAAFVVAIVFSVGLMSGCLTTSDDPRTGGLFGYDPKAYDKRLDKKKTDLEKVEEKNKAAQGQTTALEAQTEAQKAERDALLGKLNQTDREVADLAASVEAMEAKTQAASKKKWQLQTRLKMLQKDLQGLRSGSGGDAGARQAELKRLQGKIDELLAEAEELSTM